MTQSGTLRPTKKQQELLQFLDSFIGTHGYSPSYREIMVGVGYNSVATVALHINNLVARGHVAKTDNTARSLEVISSNASIFVQDLQELTENQSRWLVNRIRQMFDIVESGEPTQAKVDELFVLVGALNVLGLADAARSFVARLNKLQIAITGDNRPLSKS